MKKIIDLLNLLESQNDVFVDHNYLQGKETVFQLLTIREGSSNRVKVNADSFIDISKQTINEVIQKAHPNVIPKDYLFFLEYCGGVSINKEEYYFSTFGIGPMVDENYSSIISDSAYPGIIEQYGFLPIGDISIQQDPWKFESVSFFLDLASNVQRNCVIEIGPWLPGLIEPDVLPEELFSDLANHKDLWRVVSDSFVDWLEIMVATKGAFNFF